MIPGELRKRNTTGFKTKNTPGRYKYYDYH